VKKKTLGQDMFARIAVIDRRLKRLFWWLGTVVGQHYRVFLILPVILSVIASTGLLQELIQPLPQGLFFGFAKMCDL